MSRDRTYDDEGNPRDDDDDRPRRRAYDDEDDRPRKRRRSSSSGGDGAGKILLIVFGIGFLCVLMCCGGFGILMWIGSNEMKTANAPEGDQLFANSLASGNADSIYNNADPTFKTRYSRGDFNSFVASNPKVFERDSLWSGTIRTRYYNDYRDNKHENYKTIDSKPGGLFDNGVRIFFIEDKKTGKWVFAGVSPGLDSTIPTTLRYDPNNPQFEE